MLQELAVTQFAIDAEDSPDVGKTTQPLSIQREERRFIIGSGQSQRQAMIDYGVAMLRQYKVTTLYMEPGGIRTWSIGKSQVKFRLRQYNDEDIWWFEIKTNTEGMVDKIRRQITAEQIDRMGMRPIVRVNYQRDEFETGHDALDEYTEGKTDTLTEWLRITIDEGVTAVQVPRNVPPSAAMRDIGKPLATLKNRVLEVKSGVDQVPSWLPLPGEWDGSKSRFAVAALYGMPNRFAPSYTVKNPARAVA